MGKFIWHQWAQFVAIFAAVYTLWAGIWGILFPKFFWDFVNGSFQPGPTNALGPCTDANPCGIIPAPQDQIFINLIVKAPVVQILAMLLSIFHLILECVPQVAKTPIYRSFPLRIVTLHLQAFLAILFYQGVNGGIYSFVAGIGYVVAQVKGEEMEIAKDNRGRGGKA